jgi:hypothetical protein
MQAPGRGAALRGRQKQRQRSPLQQQAAGQAQPTACPQAAVASWPSATGHAYAHPIYAHSALSFLISVLPRDLQDLGQQAAAPPLW